MLELRWLLSAGVQNENTIARSLLIGRLADFLVALVRWKADAECPVQALARQALPMVWDFAEANPLTEATGSVQSQASRMADAIESQCIPFENTGQVQPADATDHPLPDQSAYVWFTDPPYYDAIDYSYCSDLFFVWLKRTLPGNSHLMDPYDHDNALTPKAREIVVDSTTTMGHGTRTPEFYERSMGTAFSEGRRALREDGVGSVVFAHKTTEGWEALLSGMIRGGWTITGSWPIATESTSRLRARDSAALATSVHLICRPRSEDAPVGDWADVLRELPERVGGLDAAARGGWRPGRGPCVCLYRASPGDIQSLLRRGDSGGPASGVARVPGEGVGGGGPRGVTAGAGHCGGPGSQRSGRGHWRRTLA